MIITKDMLANKGVTQEFLDAFNRECPHGLDFSQLHKYFFALGNNKGTALQEIDLAKLFAYTGISVTQHVYISCMGAACTTVKYHYVNGLLENFPNGDPAVACICDGIQNFVRFYSNGDLHNPSDRLPACINWWENGKLSSYQFFENGLLNDPFPGVPAFARYDSSGKLTCRQYFVNNQMTSETRHDLDGAVVNTIYP